MKHQDGIKKILLSIILASMICTSGQAQNAQIQMKVKGLKSSDGKVLVQVMDENKKVVKQAILAIQNKLCESNFDVPQGRYSVRIFHDENDNRKMDTNFLGIPKEGWAMSNNVKASFGPPDFGKSLFDCKGTIVQELKLNY